MRRMTDAQLDSVGRRCEKEGKRENSEYSLETKCLKLFRRQRKNVYIHLL